MSEYSMEAKVMGALGESRLSLTEVHEKTGIDTHPLLRCLQAMYGKGMVDCKKENHYTVIAGINTSVPIIAWFKKTDQKTNPTRPIGAKLPDMNTSAPKKAPLTSQQRSEAIKAGQRRRREREQAEYEERKRIAEAASKESAAILEREEEEESEPMLVVFPTQELAKEFSESLDPAPAYTVKESDEGKTVTATNLTAQTIEIPAPNPAHVEAVERLVNDFRKGAPLLGHVRKEPLTVIPKQAAITVALGIECAVIEVHDSAEPQWVEVPMHAVPKLIECLKTLHSDFFAEQTKAS